jgi:endonuclease YncB( thermonuclease family)
VTDHLIAFQYNAIVVSVHDGDTLNVVIDRGMYEYTGSADHPLPVRLLGCNAAEKGTPGGDAATANLTALLPPGTAIALTTARPDKFAPRWDADVTYRGSDGRYRDLVADLIAGQWVALWDGKGEKPVPPWPRTVAA